MIEKTIKVPDDNHPIAIERSSKRVVVMVAGKVVADTRRALTLREAGHPSVHYIPRHDVHMEALERSQTASYCPYKGEAAHFHISEDGKRLADAAWTYRTPYWAVAEIENYLAFDPDRVDRIEVTGAQPAAAKDVGAWI
jgi:uncharacterized protein (DUF427 family)